MAQAPPDVYTNIASGNQTLENDTIIGTSKWYRWVADTGVAKISINLKKNGTSYQLSAASLYTNNSGTLSLVFNDSLAEVGDSLLTLYAGYISAGTELYIKIINATSTCTACTLANPIVQLKVANYGSNCSSITTCGLVRNGGFENMVTNLPYQCGWSTVNNLINCWADYERTPDVFVGGCTTAPANSFNLSGTNVLSPSATINTANPNPHNVALGFYCASNPWNEAAQSPLVTPLVFGHTYQISLWAYNAKGTLTDQVSNVRPINALNISPYFAIASTPAITNSANFPSGQNVVASIQLTGAVNTWSLYTTTYTHNLPTAHNNIVIGPNYPTNSSNGFLNTNILYLLADQISITDITTLTFNNPTVCAGTATLNVTGANTYTWQPGNFNGTSVTGTATTVYTVTGSFASNPTCTVGPATGTLTVINNTINLTASSTTICAGSSTTLTASAAGNNMFVLAPCTSGCGSTNPANYIVTPSVTTTYTVTSNSSLGGSCNKTQTITIYVVPTGNPTLNISASPTVICAGSSSTLSASGASTYTWNPGALSGPSVAVSPTVTTTYTVTGATPCGSSTKTITVVVNPKPTVAVASQTICIGGTATLTASGANTYSWSTSATGPSITVTPSVTTNYTVTGTSAAGCTNSALATVAVTTNTIPAFSITTNPPSPVINNGTGTNTIVLSSNITNTTGLTFSWSGGAPTPTTNFNLSQPSIISLTVSNQYCGTSTQSICVNYVAASCSNTTIPVLNNAIVTSSTQIPAGVYRVTGTLTFSLSGAINVSNKTFMMATNSKIIVSPRTTLLNHTGLRIYSCDGMWNGIELQADASNAAAVNILDDAIIEDAYIGISAGTTTLSTMHSININGANIQFNKNYIDIKIVNTNSTSAVYTFTFAAKGMYSKSSGNSPGGNLKCSSYYTPIVKSRSLIGVQAKDAGIITFTVPIGGGAGINPEIQNKDYGLFFNNTDANVNNVNFNNAVGVAYSYSLSFGLTPAGVGIYTKNSKYLHVKPATTPTVGATTTFSNMGYSIISHNTATVDVQNTNHTTSIQSYTTDPAWGSGNNAYIWGGDVGQAGYGLNGVYVTNANNVLRLHNNTFSQNYFPVTTNYTIAPSSSMIMSVFQNTFSTTGTGQIFEAVRVSSALSFTPTADNMRIAANTFTNVQIGVRVTSTASGLRISNNTIKLSTTLGYRGVQLNGCSNVIVDNNLINGALTGTNVANYSFGNEGILCDNSPGCKIQCNTISNVGVGVEYKGGNSSPGAGLLKNTFVYPIRRGLVLSNGGIVGMQGSNTGSVTGASANTWPGAWPAVNNADPNQTYVGGPIGGTIPSDYINSPLWVRSTEVPFDNAFAAPSSNPQKYSFTSTTFTTAVNDYTTCPTILTSGLKVSAGGSSIEDRDEDFVRYINTILPSTNTGYTPQDKFLLKQFMFDELTQTPSSNSTLVNFYNQQQNTAINAYADIDSLLANGNLNLASTKNSSASTTNDITQTQNAYNVLYINGIQSNTDLDNLATIADLCPQQYGNAVYDARALLQSITFLSKDYNDSCYTNKLTARMGYDDENENSVSVAEGVQARLYPNPNNGSFMLAYDLKNNTDATVTIVDIAGKLVYKGSIDKLDNITSISTNNLNNGIYFIQISHDKTLLWTDKLIISK